MKKHFLLATLIVSAFGIGCASKDTDSDDYSMKAKESIQLMTKCDLILPLVLCANS